MLKLKTKADLERLIADGITESLALEYKASSALTKESKSRDELCKDVSAFANSAGGQIVYGMLEDKNAPTGLDDGADPAITKEWIEQVIDSRVQQRIEGLEITPIQLAKGLGFVLTIPDAVSRAPHQAPDKKYYKRYNFQAVPMEDYEIRDAMRRATTPLLQVKLSIGPDNRVRLNYPPPAESIYFVELQVLVTNQSPQPAFHSLIHLGLDSRLRVSDIGQFLPSLSPNAAFPRSWYVKPITSPPDQPIYKEATRFPFTITIGILSNFLSSSYFDITTVVQTPGYKSTDHWVLNCKSGLLKLYGPNDPEWMPPIPVAQ